MPTLWKDDSVISLFWLKLKLDIGALMYEMAKCWRKLEPLIDSSINITLSDGFSFGNSDRESLQVVNSNFDPSLP